MLDPDFADELQAKWAAETQLRDDEERKRTEAAAIRALQQER